MLVSEAIDVHARRDQGHSVSRCNIYRRGSPNVLQGAIGPLTGGLHHVRCVESFFFLTERVC